MDTYTIPYQGKYIVYRPLKKLAFVANAALVNLIVKTRGDPLHSHPEGDHEAFGFLETIGFWGPDPPPPPPASNDSCKPTIAVLFLTTACNFRCIYCDASAGEHSLQNLPVVLGDRAIDAVCRNALESGQDHFELAFHGGGEPTLAQENFRTLVEYAKAKDLPCKIGVSSNGFWGEAERDWILEHLDNLSLSFDGIQDVQNRQRPLASGQGTFEPVLETIRMLDQRKFPYGIRLTVTDESIECLTQSIQFLCQETACPTFQIEPAFNHGRAKRDGSALTQNDRFATAFLDAYDIATSLGRHLYYSGARPWIITTRFCQAPEQALVVTPNGDLTTCYEIYSGNHTLAHDFFLGRLFENGKMEVNQEARHRFFAKLQTRRALCADCFCYWHCAGDCPSKIFSTESDGYLRFGARCELNRMITKELLIRYITDGNGVWQGTERRIEH